MIRAQSPSHDPSPPSPYAPPGSRDHDRIDPFEIPALCLGYAFGTCCLSARLVWVAALLKTGSLSTLAVGWLASGEAFAMALGVLLVSSLGKQSNPRSIAAMAALVAALSNVLAVHAIPTMILGRLLSGLATGALVAIVTRTAAARPDAQRALAQMQAAAVLLMSVVYFASPGLIDRWGAAGLFALLVGISALMVIAALLGLPTVAAAPIERARASVVPKIAALIGCLALTTVFLGQNAIGTYLIAIAAAVGIDARATGTLLAFALPLSLLGPLAAHWLGERIGLVWPLLVGLTLLAIDIVWLVNAASLIRFALAIVALLLLVEFCTPYAIALLGRLDDSGRAAGAAPACIIVGLAVGPALGGKIVSATTGFQILALTAASCIAVGIGLFAAATRTAE